jgi:hypothetical protein
MCGGGDLFGVELCLQRVGGCAVVMGTRDVFAERRDTCLVAIYSCKIVWHIWVLIEKRTSCDFSVGVTDSTVFEWFSKSCGRGDFSVPVC